MPNTIVLQLFCLLKDHGVRHIVCSPGSRNAVLVQQAWNTGNFKLHVVVDERSAAFIALGISMVSREPVALVCTSGSAMLNYAPAVAEAFYQGVPLIVISADRPEEWINQDDSQTICQPGALGNFVKASYDISAIGRNKDEDYIWYANRLINEGMLKAMEPKCGPVHFNLHLDGKPLEISGKERENFRFIRMDTPPGKLSSERMKELATYAVDKRVMIIAGFLPPDNKMQKAMSMIARLPNVCVMAETLSNLHLPTECYMIDSVLFPMDERRAAKMAPDLLISVGGALVSRKLKEFIRNHPPLSHWALGYSDNIIDCFKSLNMKIEVDPASFLASFANRLHGLQIRGKLDSDYNDAWTAIRKESAKPVGKLPWCDLKALSIILNCLPESANLFLSNGTSVRYGQIIRYPVTHATYSNRGVSGIEGCSSTAIGCALSYERMTCLITGDMSFGYDLGALASGMADSRLRIIVLDNGGGDIFRFIPSTKNNPIVEEFLCADKKPPVATLAEAFGFEYFYANSERSLNADIEEFFAEGLAPKILHLDTRGCNNALILSNYLGKNK